MNMSYNSIKKNKTERKKITKPFFIVQNKDSSDINSFGVLENSEVNKIVKLQKNRFSAKKYRTNKKIYIKELEKKINILNTEIKKLKKDDINNIINIDNNFSNIQINDALNLFFTKIYCSHNEKNISNNPSQNLLKKRKRNISNKGSDVNNKTFFNYINNTRNYKDEKDFIEIFLKEKNVLNEKMNEFFHYTENLNLFNEKNKEKMYI